MFSLAGLPQFASRLADESGKLDMSILVGSFTSSHLDTIVYARVGKTQID